MNYYPDFRNLSSTTRFTEKDLFWFYFFIEVENIECKRTKGGRYSFYIDGVNISLREIVNRYIEYRSRRKFSTKNK